MTGGQPITVYLNAILSNCRAAVFYDLAFSADFVAGAGTFTVLAN